MQYNVVLLDVLCWQLSPWCWRGSGSEPEPSETQRPRDPPRLKGDFKQINTLREIDTSFKKYIKHKTRYVYCRLKISYSDELKRMILKAFQGQSLSFLASITAFSSLWARPRKRRTESSASTCCASCALPSPSPCPSNFSEHASLPNIFLFSPHLCVGFFFFVVIPPAPSVASVLHFVTTSLHSRSLTSSYFTFTHSLTQLLLLLVALLVLRVAGRFAFHCCGLHSRLGLSRVASCRLTSCHAHDTLWSRHVMTCRVAPLRFAFGSPSHRHSHHL